MFPEKTVAETIRVLHVDDDPDFLSLAADAVSREGPFEVVTETDPVTALDSFDADRYDAVVSDYEMPTMDGLEFLATIRERHENVPCIVFTGKGSETVASDAISVGVTDYLQKERGLEQFTLLANRLENAVEQTRTTEALRREKRRRDRILEATPMGIVVHDETGAVTLVDERARELLGATAEEMDVADYPNGAWRLTGPDGTPVDRASLPYSRVVTAGEAIHDVEYVVEPADDDSYSIVVHGAPLRDADDEVCGAVIVFGPA